MKGKMGRMNIPFSDAYNAEDDVYYVTFKTGEPSYCVEVDDALLLEVGIFSNLPTGFRILNFKKNRVESVHIGVLIRKIKQALKDLDHPTLQDRETQVERVLEEILA